MALPNDEAIRTELKKVIDPEINIDIVNLGLIYGIERIEESGRVQIKMGLTSPGCPYVPQLKSSAEQAVGQMEGVQGVDVEITLSPPWDPRTMASDEAKDILGIF